MARRPWLWLILSIVALLSAGALSAESKPAKFKIGFIAPLTGAAQACGQAARNGFDLALDESKPNIETLYEDDQFIAAKTVSAFNKLVKLNKAQLVVCIGSTPCNAVAPLAETGNIPLIAMASDRRVALNRRNVVRSYPSGEAEGARVAAEALQRGYQNLGLIVSALDYSLSWRAGVLSGLPADKLLFSAEVPAEMTDFRPLLLRGRERGVSDYLSCVEYGKSGLLARQAFELGSRPHFGGCDFFDNDDEVTAAHGALKGSWFVTLPISEEFRAKYRNRFGQEGSLSCAANHYDLARMLAIFLGKDQTGQIIPGLVAIRAYTGAAGPLVIREAEKDRFFDYGLRIKEIHR